MHNDKKQKTLTKMIWLLCFSLFHYLHNQIIYIYIYIAEDSHNQPMANKHLFISSSFFFILNDLKHYGNTNLSFTKHFCIAKAKEFEEKIKKSNFFQVKFFSPPTPLLFLELITPSSFINLKRSKVLVEPQFKFYKSSLSAKGNITILTFKECLVVQDYRISNVLRFWFSTFWLPYFWQTIIFSFLICFDDF